MFRTVLAHLQGVLVMERSGPTHVGAYFFKYYCEPNDICILLLVKITENVIQSRSLFTIPTVLSRFPPVGWHFKICFWKILLCCGRLQVSYFCVFSHMCLSIASKERSNH